MNSAALNSSGDPNRHFGAQPFSTFNADFSPTDVFVTVDAAAEGVLGVIEVETAQPIQAQDNGGPGGSKSGNGLEDRVGDTHVQVVPQHERQCPKGEGVDRISAELCP